MNIAILLLSIFLIVTQSRLYTNSYYMTIFRRNKGWIFVDRIKLAPGVATIKFTSKFVLKQPQNQKNYMVELGIIPDKNWPEQVILQCNRQIQSQAQKDNNKELNIVTQMTVNNSLSNTKQITINIPIQQTYHFVLRDCQRTLVNEYFTRDTFLEIQLYVLNNGREYGQQQRSNTYMLPLLTLLTFLLIKLNKQLRSSIDNQMDWAKLLLQIALWMNFFALLSKLISHYLYAYAIGKQYGAFDFFYLLFHSLSQSMITSLLIFIAYGWTVTFIDGKDFDLYVPLLAMLGLVNTILTLLNKINDSDHDKYHMYDTVPAYIIIIFRIVAFIIFLIGIIKTRCQITKKKRATNQFYFRFGTLGSIYLLSLPFLILISGYIKQTNREQFVFLFVQTIKNGVNALLCYMVTSKKSNYREVKYSSTSFMEQGDKYL